MKAEEARKLAKDKYIDELNGILQQIKNQAGLGNYSLYLYKHIDDKTIKRLKDLGYKVASSFDRNEILITISW